MTEHGNTIVSPITALYRWPFVINLGGGVGPLLVECNSAFPPWHIPVSCVWVDKNLKFIKKSRQYWINNQYYIESWIYPHSCEGYLKSEIKKLHVLFWVMCMYSVYASLPSYEHAGER